MADQSKIEWTDATGSVTVGCSRKSTGCQACYAERMAARIANSAKAALADGKELTDLQRAYMDVVRWGVFDETAKRWEARPAGEGVARPLWNGKVRFVESQLDKPSRWRKPRMIFVNSMSDLWHESLDMDSIAAVYEVMENNPRHIFQVLTKRPERRQEWMWRWQNEDSTPPPLNVWEGTSIESPAHLDRLKHLRATPAAVRFLSCEPLLEDLGEIDLTGIHWVIVGGESGHGARPMHPDWARSLRDQCQAQRVAFFHKQNGEFGPAGWVTTTGESVYRTFPNFQKWTHKGDTWVRRGDVCVDLDGKICRTSGDLKDARYPVVVMRKVGKKAAGRLLDGREWGKMPETVRA